MSRSVTIPWSFLASSMTTEEMPFERMILATSANVSSALAVFTSPGCALCTALEPSLRLAASDPEVELELFDEEADADVWTALAVPGSPYAVVLAPDGEVLAKGTFNSLFQLESLLVAATQPIRV